jgi:hypothetical protein
MILFRWVWLLDPRVWWREITARYRAWEDRDRERHENETDEQWCDRQPPM